MAQLMLHQARPSRCTRSAPAAAPGPPQLLKQVGPTRPGPLHQVGPTHPGPLHQAAQSDSSLDLGPLPIQRPIHPDMISVMATPPVFDPDTVTIASADFGVAPSDLAATIATVVVVAAVEAVS
jgi:hypothetical protein